MRSNQIMTKLLFGSNSSQYVQCLERLDDEQTGDAV